MTPSGTEFTGISVTIGGITDPAEIIRTYDDIEAIFKSNKSDYKVYEEKTEAGTFKSYTVESR